MAFEKGHKKGKGRPKGSPNKLTATVKQVFEDAFNKLQEDKLQNILEWGKRNPTEFYKLASKMIPLVSEISGKDGEPIQMDDTTASAKIAAILASAQARADKERK